MAEKYYSISPYAYVGNNPLFYIDPNGEWPFSSLKEIKSTVKAVGGAVLSFANGAGRAVLDNTALGNVSLRKIGVYSNAKMYNLGQDVGDAFSMVLGVAETILGSSEIAVGTAATGGSAIDVINNKNQPERKIRLNE